VCKVSETEIETNTEEKQLKSFLILQIVNESEVISAILKRTSQL
jgi:hypothetical protein